MELEIALKKWESVKMGNTVVTNAKEMDLMIESEDPFLNHLRSLPNPNRVGILDQYIAWIGYDFPKKSTSLSL